MQSWDLKRSVSRLLIKTPLWKPVMYIVDKCKWFLISSVQATWKERWMPESTSSSGLLSREANSTQPKCNCLPRSFSSSYAISMMATGTRIARAKARRSGEWEHRMQHCVAFIVTILQSESFHAVSWTLSTQGCQSTREGGILYFCHRTWLIGLYIPFLFYCCCWLTVASAIKIVLSNS